MKKLLWLDDFRNPTDYVTGEYDISWAKNYAEFCAFINEHGLPDIICFDHDLGEEKSGYDICKYIVENQIPITGYAVHSMNIVGKWNIYQLMDHYGYRRI